MQFRVFPNYETFVQRVPIDKKKHFNITDIHITSNGAFWFTTDKKNMRLNINMNHPFIHLNNCSKKINELQFDYKPYKVTRDNFKYDPRTKQLIIGDRILPWKSPIWVKRILPWKFPTWIKRILPWKSPVWVKNILGCYTGSEIPKKKVKVQGPWILDRHEKIIYFILDYAPIIRKNKISAESASKEQLEYATKLEEKLETLH